ncbi:MAG: heme-binding protein [Sumerlaeia bacterium]
MKKLFPLFLLSSSLMLTACGLVGGLVGNRSMYEEPSYTTLDTLGNNITVRQYGTRLVAEASATDKNLDEAGDDAFRLLFDYISGANGAGDKVSMTVPVEMGPKDSSEKISMTTPVDSLTSGSTVTMLFFFPQEYTLETAPVPNNSRITVREQAGETLAVLRLSGTMNEARKQEESEELLRALGETNWVPTGPARALYYDPPFTIPPLRRNEVIIPVEQRTP